MPTALPNVTGPVFQLEPELVEAGLAASRESPRRRMILPIHRQQEALVQRMLNFLQPGTYVQPHLHPRDFASESIFVMRGRIGLIMFDEVGEITSTHDLPEGSLIDFEAKLWHGLVCLSDDTIIFEVKRGPYDDEDKTFAEWAPAEGEEGAAEYLRKMEALF